MMLGKGRVGARSGGRPLCVVSGRRCRGFGPARPERGKEVVRKGITQIILEESNKNGI